MLAFSADFSKRQGTKKSSDNSTECEVARVKQLAFMFRIARVHSLLERRVISNQNNDKSDPSCSHVCSDA